MSAAEIVLWVFAALVAYTYVGYPLLLAVACLFKRRPPLPETTDWPRLTVLVVAFNEEGQILAKIKNLLACDYPADRIEVIVCSDGSTDRTNKLVTTFGDPRVKLAATKENRGINEAFANGAQYSTGDLILTTDAGGLFEPQALKIAIRHFADPTVGCVSGMFDHTDPERRPVAGGYRGYWAIETIVRQWESRLGVACVIVGAFEVIRRPLYHPIPSYLTNDMLVPMEVYAKGFRTVYEPRASLGAPQQKRTGQEFNRRVRVALRGWCSLPELLRAVPLRQTPLNWAVLWSHKYMRWLTGPMLIGLLAASALLWDHPVYRWVLAAQLVFYGAALLGLLLSAVLPRIPRVLILPYWFCVAQAAGMVGLIRAIRGRRIATWTPEP